MSKSKIDKRIKNAKLAVARAATPEAELKAKKELAAAMRAKEAGKVLRR